MLPGTRMGYHEIVSETVCFAKQSVSLFLENILESLNASSIGNRSSISEHQIF
jgi:hypothetical protein